MGHPQELRWIRVIAWATRHPQDWLWSSFRHYATGVEGVVEIESQWTFGKKERMGIGPQLRIVKVRKDPPKRSLGGAPSRTEKM